METTNMRRVIKHSAPELPTDFKALARAHPPCAIRDKIAYENTQEMIDSLTSLPTLSPGQVEYLETLSILFEAYEAEQFQIDVCDISPIQTLCTLIDDHGMSASDLGRLLGERSLGPKILHGQRELSKSHIRKLAAHFGVSPALFI